MSSIEAPREGDQETHAIEAEKGNLAAAKAVEIAFIPPEYVTLDVPDTDIAEVETVLITPPPSMPEETVPLPVEPSRAGQLRKPEVNHVAYASAHEAVVLSPETFRVEVAEPAEATESPEEKPAAFEKSAEPQRPEEPQPGKASESSINTHEEVGPPPVETSPETPKDIPAVIKEREAVTPDTPDIPEMTRFKVREPDPEKDTAPVEFESEGEPELEVEPVDPQVYLADLHQELQELRQTEDTIGTYPYFDDPYFDDAFYAVHETVRQLMDNGVLYLPPEGSCEFEFTQRVLQLVEAERRVQPFTEDDLDNIVCVQAELRLMRSLEFDESGFEIEKPLGSIILFDAYGEPYAYEKSSGIRSAYAWREAEVPTQYGVQWVPKDCFLDVQYSDEDGSADYAPRERLLVPPHRTVENIKFLRFSTAGLPLEVREQAARLATGSSTNDKLRDNMIEAVSFIPRQVGERVCRLLG